MENDKIFGFVIFDSRHFSNDIGECFLKFPEDISVNKVFNLKLGLQIYAKMLKGII